MVVVLRCASDCDAPINETNEKILLVIELTGKTHKYFGFTRGEQETK